jgi:hypothetical protein
MQIARALGPVRRSFAVAQHRKQQRRENSNHCDDDKQFDEREGRSVKGDR